jgi:hypothetical protein
MDEESLEEEENVLFAALPSQYFSELFHGTRF